MILDRVEIENYRSIRDQTGDDAIRFDGLDCLVGKNNAGKTNILSAVKFLFDESEKDLNEELFWNKETDREVVVTGYFKIETTDLNRISEQETRDEIQDLLLNEDGFENHLGIARTATMDDESVSTELRLIQKWPSEGKYHPDEFDETWKNAWDNQKDDDLNFTKTDYRDKMKDEFPELIEYIPKQKRKNKGDWEQAYHEYIRSRPDKLDFSYQPRQFPSNTKSHIQTYLLPRVIGIPAIKEIESATQRSGEFGDLVDELSDEIQDELDKQIQDELEEVNRLISSETREDRHKTIRELENHISDHLGSTFSNRSIRLNFPEFSTEYLFRQVNIKIQESRLESISTDNVGEGVKRMLIFSLLRTLADLWEGRLELGDTELDSETPRPLLIIYEEAELFLHPQLQNTLLSAFSELTPDNAQVVFSTHSPHLIDENTLETINIVRNKDNGTEVIQFKDVLEKYDPSEKRRLMNLKRVSSYIFADKVVMVEGPSDEIVLKKLTGKLNSDWNFEFSSIPILTLRGKGDMTMFREFLEDLDIDPYLIVDQDAIVDILPKLTRTEDTEAARRELKRVSESHLDTNEGFSPDGVPMEIQTKPEDERLDMIVELYEQLEEGTSPTEISDNHLQCLGFQLSTMMDNSEEWQEVAMTDRSDIQELRNELRAKLLRDNTLLLEGDIEDNYPTDGDKIDAALNFDPSEYSEEELLNHFTDLPHDDQTDLEAFLNTVFSTT